MLRANGDFEDGGRVRMAEREVVRHFAGVVQLVGRGDVVDGGDGGVEGVGGVDLGYGCFVG